MGRFIYRSTRPRFGGLYTYSSSSRDLSNSRSYEEFFEHYEFVVQELYRLTPPGRLTAVHCSDVPKNGASPGGGLMDLPGDVIRLHEKIGFRYAERFHIWKEPLAVRNRTMSKGLAHCQTVTDSSKCSNARADYLLLFRKRGENKVPVTHERGFTRYAGEKQMPADVLQYKGWKGKQIENRFSHWIWRNYADAFWLDIRQGRVLPYKSCKDHNDEKHVHPLQLDVIERAVVLWSNPGEVVLTPFAGVGSEVYGAVINGRKGVGIELKPAYYRQMVQNLKAAKEEVHEQDTLFK